MLTQREQEPYVGVFQGDEGTRQRDVRESQISRKTEVVTEVATMGGW